MAELPEARKRPRQEEDCQYEACGHVSDEVIAHYDDPAVCNPLRAQARAASSKCPLGSAPARLLRLLRARLPALGSSAIPE